MTSFTVQSPNVQYGTDEILSNYTYRSTRVEGRTVYPVEERFTFKTESKVPKLGLMLVGWGGNNGTTITAGILANKNNIHWQTKEGEMSPNYYGSLTQASTVRLGTDHNTGRPVNVPFHSLLPMVNPNDIVLSGWDISGMNLADAMKRAKVLDYDLQRQLAPLMQDFVPLPSIYNESFIAMNQGERADNVLKGDKEQQLEKIRENIRDFKTQNNLDKVIVLWTATTERFAAIIPGINDTAENVLQAIKTNHSEIAPSTIFAVASILEHVTFINGSPQNTFVPGVIELATQHHSFIVGDDFKTGQTKLKSVLVDYLVSAGIKPVSIVSYNHLGNNDGKNLSAPEQFKSKEITKTDVIDDMIESNEVLYADGEVPDHCVVIKYVPYVGDSKRAMDEYTSEIFLHGKNTLVIHNTCEDSLLASPIILDLVIISELCERIQIRKADDADFERFHPVLSLLGYLMKAPAVPHGTLVVNALNAQRHAIVNLFKACVGLPPDDYLELHHRLPSLINEQVQRKRLHDEVKGGKEDEEDAFIAKESKTA